MMFDYQSTTIDLLRHGECEGGKIYRGSTNVSLSDEGWKNMQSKVDWLTGREDFSKGWDIIVSSPMERCIRFASSVAEERNIDVQEESNFRETYFGDWEGKLVEDIVKAEPEKVDAWFRDPENHYAPNGEPTRDFFNRVNDGLQTVLSKHKGKRVLLVSHGGVMRSLIANILNLPLSSMNQTDIPYACLSRIDVFHSEEHKDFMRLTHHNVPV